MRRSVADLLRARRAYLPQAIAAIMPVRRPRKLSVALVAFFSLAGMSQAASLTLYSDAPSHAPLVITPLDSTDKLLVKVVNNTAADPPSEFLTGWQVELHIAPDSGAIGSLGFASAGKPANYLFDGVGHLAPASAILVMSCLPSTLISRPVAACACRSLQAQFAVGRV